MAEEEKTHTILVVDDNEDNRDLIRRRLERTGYRVLEAEDGMQALERVQGEPIDLVILDVMMPGISGIEVLRILRQTHTAAELPIIMATAKDQSEDVVEALDHGANDYVTKPLDFPVVLARVQAQLRARTAAEKKTADKAATFGPLKPGSVLMGKYRLEEVLGSGNFGKVFRATHLGFQQQVAVKVLHTVDDSKEMLERFRQEGVSAFRLQHPHVVSVHDFDILDDGQAFLVMELLEGHSLEAELDEKGTLDPERCGEIILPVCDALAEAHHLGIIHRDIKPANIYLHQRHRGETVKILDFGIAKLVGDAAMEKELTLDEAVLGTPAYLAPERLTGEDYDGRADVYALGVVLYQMLAGHPPYPSKGKEAIAVAMMHITQQPKPLRERRPGVPPAVEAVVMETLRKDPRERPDAKTFARIFEQALKAHRFHRGGLGRTAGTAPPPAATRRAATPPAAAVKASARDPKHSLGFEFSDLLEPPAGPSVSPLPPRRAGRPLPGTSVSPLPPRRAGRPPAGTSVSPLPPRRAGRPPAGTPAPVFAPRDLSREWS